MKKVILFVVGMMVGNFVMAQAPAIQWAKCYGGSRSESALAIQQTKDGGYIIAGGSASNDGNVMGHHGGIDSLDCWVIKINATGAIQWQKSLGGNKNDYAISIEQTTDDGYILAGSTNSNDGDVTGNHGFYDYWVVKLNDTGGIQWQKTLGGTSNDFTSTIHQTTDGGYIVAGYSGSTDGDVTGHHGAGIAINNDDYWIVKISANGAIQWQKSLGGTKYDIAYSIQQTTDGGYIVAGGANSNDGDVTGNHGNNDYWVVKLNSVGTIQWQKSFGGAGNDYSTSIQQTNDGGYIVAGSSTSNDGDVFDNHGDHDYWVVKLNSAGTIQWQNTLGGISPDDPTSILQTKDGGYIIVGSTASNDGDITFNNGSRDTWVVKINANSSIQWQKCLGGSYIEEAFSITQTTDSGYIVAGRTESQDGDVTGFHGTSDFWVVKLAKDFTDINETPSSSITLSPNPTKGIITIKGITQPSVAVYNLMGQKVVATQGSNEVSLAQLATGLYLVQVFSKEGELLKSEKVMKE